jgi:hypothetical protein
MTDTPKREPLFSDTEAWDLVAPIYHAVEGCSGCKLNNTLVSFGEEYVRRKIAVGELVAVKEVTFISNDYDGNIDCNSCGWSICYIHVDDNPMKFCPGCGSRIVE